MFVRKVVVALAFALILSSVPQIALAADSVTYTDDVTGRELFATSTLGVFAGTATGSLPGSWSAYIWHTPLDPSAVITGGSFSLATTIAGSAARVRGTFVLGGTVTQTGGFTGCADQTYLVQGTLAQVGVGGGAGTGTFSATLTHHRSLLWGRYCVTYKATVLGQVVLIF